MMTLGPICTMELYFQPEERTFQARVLAEPHLEHDATRKRPFAWCSFSYWPGGEVIVID